MRNGQKYNVSNEMVTVKYETMNKEPKLETWRVCEEYLTHHTVHVGLCPDNVMVVVYDHRSTQHMQVFHHILLYIR